MALECHLPASFLQMVVLGKRRSIIISPSWTCFIYTPHCINSVTFFHRNIEKCISYVMQQRYKDLASNRDGNMVPSNSLPCHVIYSVFFFNCVSSRVNKFSSVVSSPFSIRCFSVSLSLIPSPFSFPVWLTVLEFPADFPSNY